MPDFAQKPNDPASAFDNSDLGLTDPPRIGHSDWTFNPRLAPNTDDPDPRNGARLPDPRVPGGDPSTPNPFTDLFDGPKPGSAPDNPFTPEEQARIKAKHDREDAEAAERQRSKLRQDLGLDPPAPAKSDDRGDGPFPPGDTATT